MPRKTLKEKQAAAMRRIHIAPKTEQAARPVPSRTEVSEEDKAQRSYFSQDLRKSLVIVTVVFALEFLLYYATMSNYLGIIKF